MRGLDMATSALFPLPTAARHLFSIVVPSFPAPAKRHGAPRAMTQHPCWTLRQNVFNASTPVLDASTKRVERCNTRVGRFNRARSTLQHSRSTLQRSAFNDFSHPVFAGLTRDYAFPVSVRRRWMSALEDFREREATSEAELIARCGRGDSNAFDAIVAKHQDRVFNLCFWMLHDHDEASDAAQDAFLRAYRALEAGKFRGESSLGTWLHRIASNVALDAARSKKNRPVSFSSLSRPGDDAPDDPEPAPEDAPISLNPAEALARNERQAAIRQALFELPEHHRLALVLFDIEGHSYEQIGELLKLPVGTVKSRLNRARAALRDKLEARRELWDAG